MSKPKEWQEPKRTDRFHDFWYKATPKIFEWLGWVGILAAIEVVYSKNAALPIMGLRALGYCSLLFYFTAFFQHHPVKIPGIRHTKLQYLFSFLFSVGLAYSVNRLAQYVVAAFAVAAP